jgi:hypothetical protein
MSTTQTYDLIGSAIVCRLCGFRSHHPDDIISRYCVMCHLFHDAVAQVRRILRTDPGATHECGEWRSGDNICAVCGRGLLREGDRVDLATDERAVPAVVELASDNGRSIAVAFEAIVLGYVGHMPIRLDDDGHWICAMDGARVHLRRPTRE